MGGHLRVLGTLLVRILPLSASAVAYMSWKTGPDEVFVEVAVESRFKQFFLILSLSAQTPNKLRTACSQRKKGLFFQRSDLNLARPGGKR